MEVEVIRSRRRRKTVQAWEIDGKLRVAIPAWMTKTDEERYVADMVKRMQRRAAAAEAGLDLTARAGDLAQRYGLPRPTSIRWVDNQRQRWGSCTPEDGAIRLSSRMADYPPWVVDYVIVHELAHLLVDGHGPAFTALVERYPRAERARGFLIAKGMEEG